MESEKMGDRISIQFKTEGEYSVVLFSHWDGLEFKNKAKKYAQELMEWSKGETYPLERFEPNTVMIDFIREITEGETRIKSNYYLGCTETDGDNSDNGHYIIEFKPQTKKIIVK